MRRIVSTAALAAATFVALFPSPLSAQSTQTARGTVTAIAADSFTVSAGDRQLTFVVDAKTVVTATGAGTAARAAEAAGKSGPKLDELLKVGEADEVNYHYLGGKLHAANVRRTRSPGPGGGGVAEATKTEIANGTVDSVTGTSIAITGTSGGGSTFKQSFTIDSDTKVIGRGVGTAAQAKGGKVGATDLIAVGDRVSVSYRTVGTTLTASEIRVTARK